MDEEDEIALKKLNASPQSGFGECSEDHFEEVMNFFEDTAKNKQPFAAVDNPPVLPLEEIEEQYDEFTAVHIRKFAKPIYDHWKNRRISSNNHGLEPRLRFETGQDTDDADPYVCFRRRELRQTRKTRNRDAQSAEKLRRLRKELEDARQILQMVKQREVYRKEQIQTDKMLFIQRCEVKETKRKLDIKGDDEDLVNQKVLTLLKRVTDDADILQPKKKILAELSPGQQQLAPHLRIPIGRPDELRTLEDWQHERDKAIQREISLNTEKHVRWNEGYVDKTMAPLTPVTSTEIAFKHGFRPAMPETTMLPTPPASESAGSPPHDSADAGESSKAAALKPFPYASPIEDDSHLSMPSFRRRVGRGGRLLIDRRMPFRTKRDHADDRFRFDNSDSDEPEIEQDDDTDLFHSMMHRAYLFGKGRDAEAAAQVHRRSQIEMATSSSQPNGVMPNGTPMQRQAATPS